MKDENTHTAALPAQTDTWSKLFFWIGCLASLTPWVSPPIALLLGLIFAQVAQHPYATQSAKATHLLLQISVVGLGFGMNALAAWQAGKSGFVFTIATIAGILVLGFFLGRLLRIHKKTAYLISSGTAICGGSAIAALSPVIQAKQEQISVALGTVFILNSVTLFVFPFIGEAMHMSQTQFGMWCAIAIHDTSSVVGAAAKYGDEALGIATTVKLARALWIIPIAFMSTLLFKSKNAKIQIPYFIGLFVVAILLNTYVPVIHQASDAIVALSKAGLTATLFLIGCSLSGSMWKAVGVKPLVQGVLQWVVISVVTLMVILHTL